MWDELRWAERGGGECWPINSHSMINARYMTHTEL